MPRVAFLFLDLQTVLRHLVPESAHAGFDAAVLKAQEVLEFARGLGDETVICHVIVGGSKPKNDHTNYSATRRPSMMEQLHKHEVLQPVTTDNHHICPELTPLPNEIVSVRPRISSFHDTDLNKTLRELGVEELVICGFATRGIVLSTFVSAIDHDYAVTVIKDACADMDDEVHRVLTEKYFQSPFAASKCLTVEEFKKEFKI